MKKVAIIGAGAAGLSAAVTLARFGFAVDVFEKNAKNAKKILVSGNGHCNITNRFLTVYFAAFLKFSSITFQFKFAKKSSTYCFLPDG